MLIIIANILFYLSLISFCKNRKHLLSLLLSLEFITLIIFLVLRVFLSFYDYEFYFLIVFLTFAVCEGALGLSILVSIVRTHGNDYFRSFNVL